MSGRMPTDSDPRDSKTSQPEIPVNLSSWMNCGWVSCNSIKGSGCFISVQMNNNFIKLKSISLVVWEEDSRCLIKTCKGRTSSGRNWKGNAKQPRHGFWWCVRLWRIAVLVWKQCLFIQRKAKLVTWQIFWECFKLSTWLEEIFSGVCITKAGFQEGMKSCVLACWWCRVSKEPGSGMKKMNKCPGLIMSAWENCLGFSMLQTHYSFINILLDSAWYTRVFRAHQSGKKSP